MSGILITPTMLLADSHSSYNTGLITRNAQKLFCLHSKDGESLAGVVGEGTICRRFVQWARHMNDPWPKNEEHNFSAVILRPHTYAQEYNADGYMGDIQEPVWAIGSVRDLLLGALWHGATLLDACHIAAQRACYFAFPLYWAAFDHKAAIHTGVICEQPSGPSLDEFCTFCPDIATYALRPFSQKTYG